MYALPGESVDDLKKDLEIIICINQQALLRKLIIDYIGC